MRTIIKIIRLKLEYYLSIISVIIIIILSVNQVILTNRLKTHGILTDIHFERYDKYYELDQYVFYTKDGRKIIIYRYISKKIYDGEVTRKKKVLYDKANPENYRFYPDDFSIVEYIFRGLSFSAILIIIVWGVRKGVYRP